MDNEQWGKIQENIKESVGATWVKDDLKEMRETITKSIHDHYLHNPATPELNIILNYNDLSTYTIEQKATEEGIRKVVDSYKFTNRETLKARVIFNGLVSADVNEPFKSIEIKL